MKRFFALVMALILVVSLMACTPKGAIVYNIGNVDRAGYFQKTVNNLVDEYGEAKLEGDILTGVAVVRLLDFSGDGVYELYVAYADGTKDYVNKQLVVGFDMGAATLLDEEITSKATADDATPSICIFKDTTGRAYLVVGEDRATSAEYITYIQTRGEEKVYAFDTEFTEVDGATSEGTYETIKLSGLTKEDSKYIFEENEKVTDSINGLAEN